MERYVKPITIVDKSTGIHISKISDLRGCVLGGDAVHLTLGKHRAKKKSDHEIQKDASVGRFVRIPEK